MGVERVTFLEGRLFKMCLYAQFGARETINRPMLRVDTSHFGDKPNITLREMGVERVIFFGGGLFKMCLYAQFGVREIINRPI